MGFTTKAEVGLEGSTGLLYGVRCWYFGGESCESVACDQIRGIVNSLGDESLIVFGETLTICSLRLRFRILEDLVRMAAPFYRT